MKIRAREAVVLVGTLAWGCGTGSLGVGPVAQPVETVVANAAPRPAIVTPQMLPATSVPRSVVPRLRALGGESQCTTAGIPSASVQAAAAAGLPVTGAVGWRFELSGTSTIYLAALVRNVCGPHVASFDVYRPDGSLYTRLWTPFDTDEPTGPVRRVEDGYVVELPLPLATAATTGVWSVNFTLGDKEQVAGYGLFELVP